MSNYQSGNSWLFTRLKENIMIQNEIVQLVNSKIRLSDKDIIQIYNKCAGTLNLNEDNSKIIVKLITQLSKPSMSRYLQHKDPQAIGKLLAQKLDTVIYAQRIISQDIISLILSDLTQYSLYANQKATPKAIYITNNVIPIIIHNLNQQHTIDCLKKIEKKQPTLLQNLMIQIFQHMEIKIEPSIAEQLSEILITYITNKQIHDCSGVIRFKIRYYQQYTAKVLEILQRQLQNNQVILQQPTGIALAKELLYIKHNQIIQLSPEFEEQLKAVPHILAHMRQHKIDLECVLDNAKMYEDYIEKIKQKTLNFDEIPDIQVSILIQECNDFQVKLARGLIESEQLAQLVNYQYYIKHDSILYVLMLMQLPGCIQRLKKCHINQMTQLSDSIEYNIFQLEYNDLLSDQMDERAMEINKQIITDFSNANRAHIKFIESISDKYKNLKILFLRCLIHEIIQSDYYQNIVASPSKLLSELLQNTDKDKLINTYGLQLIEIPKNADLKTEQNIKKENQLIQQRLAFFKQQEQDFVELFDNIIGIYFNIISNLVNLNDKQSRISINQIITNIICTRPFALAKQIQQIKQIFTYLGGHDSVSGAIFGLRQQFFQHIRGGIKKLLNTEEKTQFTQQQFVECITSELIKNIQVISKMQTHERWSLLHCLLPWIQRNIKQLSSVEQSNVLVAFAQMAESYQNTYNVTTKQKIPIPRCIEETSILQHQEAKILAKAIQYIPITTVDFQSQKQILHFCFHITGTQTDAKMIEPLIQFVVSGNQQEQHLATEVLLHTPNIGPCINDDKMRIKVLFAEAIEPQLKGFFQLNAGRNQFMLNAKKHANFLLEQLNATIQKEINTQTKNNNINIFYELIPKVLFILCDEAINGADMNLKSADQSVENFSTYSEVDIFNHKNSLTTYVCIHALTKLFDLQVSIEETRLDIDTPMSRGREVYWKIIETLSQFYSYFNSSIPCQLPIGAITAPLTKYVKSEGDVNDIISQLQKGNKVEPQTNYDGAINVQAEYARRFELSKQPISSSKYVVSQNYICDFVKTLTTSFQQLPVSINPKKSTIFQAILERYLQVTIFEQDQNVQTAAFNAIKSILKVTGDEFTKSINNLIESGRKLSSDQIIIPESIQLAAARLEQHFYDITKYGCVHWLVVKREQMPYLVNDAVSHILQLRTFVTTFVQWKDDLRINAFKMIEKANMLQDKRLLDSSLNKTLGSVWKQLLTSSFNTTLIDETKQETKLNSVEDHMYTQYKNYNTSFDFVFNNALPLWKQRLLQEDSLYPGACYNVAGLIITLGLSCLKQQGDLLETIIQSLLHDKSLRKQIEGLQLLLTLQINFKQMLEPYIPAVIVDVLILDSSPDRIVQQLSRTFLIQVMKYSTVYGIQCIASAVLAIFEGDTETKLLLSTVTFIYNVVSNKGKLSPLFFRHMLSKLVPKLLPGLQIAIHHTNGDVQQVVKDTLLKIVDQSTNPSIRKLGPRIVDAYINQRVIRDVLIDLTAIQLQSGIDTAALLLVYPLCERVLQTNSSEFLQQANERMPGVHAKTIAAHIMGILTAQSSPTDFMTFAQQARNVLISNLRDNDDGVKSACAKNIVIVAGKSRVGPQQVYQELLNRLSDSSIVMPYAHGLCQALTELSFDMQCDEVLLYLINEAMMWHRYKSYQKLACKCSSCGQVTIIDVPDEFLAQHSRFFAPKLTGSTVAVQEDGVGVSPLLASCNSCNQELKYEFRQQFRAIGVVHMCPMLLYVPLKLLELRNEAHIVHFIDHNIVDAFKAILSVVAVRELRQGNEEQLNSISRLLCTGFVSHENTAEKIAIELINGMRSSQESVRDTCVLLVGDLVSELGSLQAEKADIDIKSDNEQLQQIKNKIKSIRGQQTEHREKVFIPESSLAYAAKKIGEKTFKRILLMIYLLRHEDSNVRHHATNIWKLITIQALRAINSFLEILFDECCILLNDDSVQQRSFYQQLIKQGITDIVRSIAKNQLADLTNKVKDKILNETTDQEKICSLYLYATMVKEDKTGIVSDQKIIEMLPKLVKGNTNQRLVSAASTLIASLNTGADDVLEEMIAPQLATLDQQTPDQVQYTAQSILAIADQRSSLLLKITLQCINQPELTEQIALLITHFIKLSTCLQQQLQDIIINLIQRVQKDANQMLLNAKKQKEIPKVHYALYILNQLLQEEFSNEYIGIMQQVIKNQLSFKNIEIQGPASLIATLMIQYKTVLMVEERMTIGSLIQCLIDNLSNEAFSGICSLCFNKIGQIASSNLNTQMLNLIVLYIYSSLQTTIRVYNSHLPCLLKIKMELLQLFQPMLVALSNQVDNEIQIQSLEIMAMFILASYNTKCTIEHSKETQKLTYNDYHYTLPTLVFGNQQLDILTQVLIGRLILVFKQKISDKQRLCMLEIVSTLSSFVNFSSYEMQLSLEIQHYCLLHPNDKIQDKAIGALLKLINVSKNKSNSIYNILKILFIQGVVEEQVAINKNITTTLYCKIVDMLSIMVKNTTLEAQQINFKQGELRLVDTNMYSSIVHLVWVYVMIVENMEQEIIQHCSKLIAMCLIKLLLTKQEEVFTLQLIKCVFFKSDYLQTVCSQLRLLSDLFKYTVEDQKSEDIYKILQYVSGNISKYVSDAEDRPFITRLNQLLDVNTSRQYYELSELCNFVGVFLAAQYAGKWDGFYKDYQSLLVKVVKKLLEWMSNADEAVKMSVINMLNTVYDIVEQKMELSMITLEQCQLLCTQIGVISFQYLAKALVDSQISQAAQKCFIDFFELKVGGQVLKNACALVSQKKRELADEMEHRAGVLMKQLKRGMI